MNEDLGQHSKELRALLVGHIGRNRRGHAHWAVHLRLATRRCRAKSTRSRQQRHLFSDIPAHVRTYSRVQSARIHAAPKHLVAHRGSRSRKMTNHTALAKHYHVIIQ